MRLNSREEWGAYEVPELTIKERKRRMNMLDKDERGMMNEEGDEQEDDEHIVEEGSDIDRGKRQGSRLESERKRRRRRIYDNRYGAPPAIQKKREKNKKRR